MYATKIELYLFWIVYTSVILSKSYYLPSIPNFPMT